MYLSSTIRRMAATLLRPFLLLWWKQTIFINVLAMPYMLVWLILGGVSLSPRWYLSSSCSTIIQLSMYVPRSLPPASVRVPLLQTQHMPIKSLISPTLIHKTWTPFRSSLLLLMYKLSLPSLLLSRRSLSTVASCNCPGWPIITTECSFACGASSRFPFDNTEQTWISLIVLGFFQYRQSNGKAE